MRMYKELSDEKIDSLLHNKILESNRQIIVLDDDPTGIQTVHGISVYTDGNIENIRDGFQENTSLFYILTNSRSLNEKRVKEMYRNITQNIITVSKELEQNFLIVSRSDSTLRGHYPLETKIIKDVLEENGQNIDGEILSFFFLEGGRVTINDIHYVIQDNQLILAADTEFAQDPTFGYENSDLKKYIQEKTEGTYKEEEIKSISLSELSKQNYKSIYEKIFNLESFNKLIVNSLSYKDLKVFSISLYEALKTKNFIIRSSASLVKVLGGITDKPLLKKNEMLKKNSNNGGLIVVGSYTEKTNSQLKKLLEDKRVIAVEINSDLIIKSESLFEDEINKKTQDIERIISKGKTAVCYTKRKLLKVEGEDKKHTLSRSAKISDGVKNIVKNLETEPKFIIAKGGITSSDIGTKALNVKKADVLGQILEGIPVWETGSESKFPGIPYIIFPGNTGDEKSLKKAVEILLD